MARKDRSQRISPILKSAASYGLWFAVVGTMVGVLGGEFGGAVYEYATGTSGGNSPLLFPLTASIGAFLGIIYGIWKEVG
ncbi:MAG: hypothetical protein ACREEM_35900 [Blastocatellia bacterium]